MNNFTHLISSKLLHLAFIVALPICACLTKDSQAAIVVDAYSDVVPYVVGHSQFTVSATNGGLTINGTPTAYKVFVFAEIYRAGQYHIVGAIDNFSTSKYPNGYGYLRPQTQTDWGLLDGERPDRYVAGIDFNLDGRIGLWDSATETLVFDPGEYIAPEWITVTANNTFQTGFAFQVQAVSIVPEPMSIWLPIAISGLLIWRIRRSTDLHSNQN